MALVKKDESQYHLQYCYQMFPSEWEPSFFFLLFICLKLLLNLFVKRKLWWRYFWMQVIGAPLRNVSAGLLKELCRIPAVSPHMKWRVWWIIRSWMLKIIFVVCVQSGWDRKWRSKKWTHSDEIREQTFYWSR